MKTRIQKLQVWLCLLSLLSVSVGSSAHETVTYYHNDYLGSPVILSNDQANTITDEGYEPFGKRLYSKPLGESNDQWFTGRAQDPNTDLIYMNARFYNPTIGRFMAIDPAGFDASNPQSFNRYLYVNNNPYKYVDPDGEILFLIPAVIWAAGAAMTAYDTYTAYKEGGVAGAAKSLAIDAALTAVGGKIVGKVAEKGYDLYKNSKRLGNAAEAVGERAAKICCFLAGTPVLTKDGYKNIEDIQLGDLVLSKDVDTGEQGWKPVTALFEKYRVIYQLDVVAHDGQQQSIFTTDDHPFYVIGKGFVGAVYLTPGDLIATDDGGWVAVQSVANTERQDRTYNLEVADFHTYYATKLDLLVHNCNLDVNISAVAKDWGVKGAHIKVSGIELAVRPGADGALVLKNVFSRDVGSRQTANAMKTAQEALANPDFRQKLHDAAGRAINLLKHGDEVERGRALELRFLQEALKKLGLE